MKIGERGMLYEVFLSEGEEIGALLGRLKKKGIMIDPDVEEVISSQPILYQPMYEVVLIDGHSLSRSHLSYEVLSFEARRLLLVNLNIEAACILFASVKADFMDSFGFEVILAFHPLEMRDRGKRLLALFYEKGVFSLKAIPVPHAVLGKKSWAFAFQR